MRVSFHHFAREAGFTVVEMMAVLVILAFLAGGSISFYLGYIEKGKINKAKAEIAVMQAALDGYYMENNCYPEQAATDGIATLIQLAPTGISADAADPWGFSYQYSSDGTSYHLYTGKTGIQGVAGQRVYGTGRKGVSQPPGMATFDF